MGRKKVSGKTVDKLAARVAAISGRVDGITQLTIGAVTAKGSGGHTRKVRFADMVGGFELRVKNGNVTQPVYVYTPDVQAVRLAVSRALRNQDISICFTGND